MSLIKSRGLKLLVCIIVLACTICGSLPFYNSLSASALTNSEITAKLDSYKLQYQLNSYWNDTTNGKYGGIQCYEFARMLADNLFSKWPATSFPSSNGQESNGYTGYILKKDGNILNNNINIEPGDIISVSGNQHHAMVWKVDGQKIYVAEAWGSQNNKINWGFFNGWSTQSTITEIMNVSSYTGVYVWKHPGGSTTSTGSLGTAATPSYMSISGQTAPTGTLKLGSYFDLRGIVTSNKTITSLTAGVYYSNGTQTAQIKTVNPNSTTYNLYNIDSYIKFNALIEGSYYYRVSAKDSSGNTFVLVNSSFSIAAATPTISGNQYPSGNLPYGKGYGIYGTINSSSALGDVTVGVYNTNGTATSQVRTITTSNTSCSIGTYFDPYILFNKLSRGSYVYKITVKGKVIFTSNFKIV